MTGSSSANFAASSSVTSLRCENNEQERHSGHNNNTKCYSRRAETTSEPLKVYAPYVKLID